MCLDLCVLLVWLCVYHTYSNIRFFLVLALLLSHAPPFFVLILSPFSSLSLSLQYFFLLLSSLSLPPSFFFLRYKVTTEVVGAGAIEDAGLEGTEYEWEQVKWDPITGNLQCAIHFAFPDGSRLDDAFQYVLESRLDDALRVRLEIL